LISGSSPLGGSYGVRGTVDDPRLAALIHATVACFLHSLENLTESTIVYQRGAVVNKLIEMNR
jgi:hypothetical protein